MLHSIFRALVRILLKLFFRVRIRGRLQPAPKLLIISNHQSFLDGIFLGAFLPVQPLWLVHRVISQRWYFRLPLKLVPHMLVDTHSPLAMKAVAAEINANRPVLIFAEGRISTTGGLMKIYDGPAFVAWKTGADVVPVHIEGPKHTRFGRMSGDFPKKLFPRVTITIQSAHRMPDFDVRLARERRRKGAEWMRRLMQEAAFAGQPRTTLFPALLDAIAMHGRRRLILEDLSGDQSYGRVLKGALALGRLIGRHTAEDENVGILMPNVGTTLALLFGMFATRRVPAMLNYTAGPEGMQNACDVAGVRTVITSRAFVEKARLSAAVDRIRHLRVLYLEDLRREFSLTDKLWLMLWALRFPGRVMRPAPPDHPAVILFTSGSEGKPKGVVLSHANILANIYQLLAVIDCTSKDKILAALPFFHAFGLTVGGILPLVVGARLLVYPSPLHYRVIPEMIYDRDCTVMFATNTFLANYARVAHPYDLRTLRIAGAGAEKLSDDVRRLYIEKFGVRLLEGYGATESSPVIALNTFLAYKSGTVGELLPGMEARLESVSGIDGGGILHVRGPNVMLGYLRAERPGAIQPPESVFGAGWYSTGDVVDIEAGFITIRGRLRRFAKVAGEMVSLETVERLAETASPGRVHAAAAVKHPQRGEVIVLCTQDHSLRREHLIEAARASGSSELAVPRRIVWVETIPVLGNGKKDYVSVQRIAEESAREAVTRT